MSMWWAHQDSNLEPKDHESRNLALQIRELGQAIFPTAPTQLFEFKGAS